MITEEFGESCPGGNAPPTYDPGQGQYAVVATPNESWESHGGRRTWAAHPTTNHCRCGLTAQKDTPPPDLQTYAATY